MNRGNRALRVRRRVLQAPVIRYVNRRTGQAVTLISVAHIADSRYFEEITGAAAALEAAGAVVQYELIGRASDAEWAEASEAERAADAAIGRSERARSDALMGYLRWDHQGRAFCPLPSWVNADLTDLEYIRLVGAQRVLADERAASETIDILGGQADRVLGAGFAVLYRLLALDRWQVISRLTHRDSVSRVIKTVTVAGRSDHAVAMLPGDRDAVMIWGAGHLASIHAGLTRLGFTRSATRWLNVGTLPSVYAALRDIAAAIRSAR